MKLLPILSITLSLALSACRFITPGYSESDVQGFWDLRYLDRSYDRGLTWERNVPVRDFLHIMPDGHAECGDPTGLRHSIDDVVWSLRSDSLFYHSPSWSAMCGKTAARIVKCDNDTLILEEGNKYRYIYSKRK